jgi:hypothetical protein
MLSPCWIVYSPDLTPRNETRSSFRGSDQSGIPKRVIMLRTLHASCTSTSWPARVRLQIGGFATYHAPKPGAVHQRHWKGQIEVDVHPGARDALSGTT